MTDLDLSAAQSVASTCGDKAKATRVNVTNHAELVAVMRQADLVVNCVGPFFRFGVPVLAAAIEAGRDYLDICEAKNRSVGGTAPPQSVKSLCGS